MKLKNLADVCRAIDERKESLAAVVVHLNDTYVLEERSEDKLPGFPRLIATVQALRKLVLEKTGQDRTFVVHSGDFLGPSLIGKKTEGRAMVEMLNRLGLDWCTLGNHELDYGEKKLVARLAEAKFGVTLSSAVLPPQIRNENLVLWPSPEQPVLAVTGITSESVGASFPKEWSHISPREAMDKFVQDTENIPFRIAITHASLHEDKEMAEGVKERTIILGGHDHDIDFISIGGVVPIMKNLANLQSVRLLLLYSGSAGAYLALRAAYDRERKSLIAKMPDLEREKLLESDERKLMSFADYSDQLLREIRPGDAETFRSYWRKRAEKGALPSTMIDAIELLPNYGDFDWALLTINDHLPAKREDLELVEQYLRLVPVEDRLIKDWSSQLPDGIEARDGSMRYVQNPFGQFTAACVQKYAALKLDGVVDLALVHAGHFRADSVMSGKLTLRALHECFLYDSDSAMIVLRLPTKYVLAMVDAGLSKSGGGGFPQLSNEINVELPELRIAISSYLLEDSRSIDEYDKVLMGILGITDGAELRRWVGERVELRFSIIAAIENFAQSTELKKLSRRVDLSRAVDMFVFYADLLYKLEPNLKVSDTQLGSDSEMEQRQVMIARNNLRRWLRELPVNTPNNHAAPKYPELQLRVDDKLRPGIESLLASEGVPDYAPDSYKQLILLYKELEHCPQGPRAGRSYHRLMERVATGIGGWLGP